MNETASRDEPSGMGCAIALGLVTVPALAMWVLRPSSLSEEWPILLFWGVMFALPFGYLALATRRWKPWLLTAVLTIGIWGALIFITWRSEPGVNFGIGLLMLVAPIVIMIGAAAAVHMANKQAQK